MVQFAQGRIAISLDSLSALALGTFHRGLGARLHPHRAPRRHLNHLALDRSLASRSAVRPRGGPPRPVLEQPQATWHRPERLPRRFWLAPPGQDQVVRPTVIPVPIRPAPRRLSTKAWKSSRSGFLEQNPLYNAINQNLAIIGGENSTIHSVAVSTFACPSDHMSGLPRVSTPVP